MTQLDSKDSSRNLRANCAIYFFYPYFILHACVQIDVAFFTKIFWDLNKTLNTAKPLRMLNFKLRWSLCCRNLLSAENDNHELADSGHQHVNRRFLFFSAAVAVFSFAKSF